MISDRHGSPRLTKTTGWPLEPVYWTSPTLNNGKLVSSSSRVRVMEIYGNRNLLISSDIPHPPQARPSSQGISSSRGSPCSQLSDQSIHSNSSSPSHSPMLQRTTAATESTSWSSNPKSSSRSSGGNSQRRRGPGFILRPQPQNVKMGEKLCLNCSLLGHPKPTVTWEKDGELVDEERTNGRIRTFINGNDYKLVVESAGHDDAGKYAVTARNSLGKQTAAVDVVVEGLYKRDGSQSSNGGVRLRQSRGEQLESSALKNNSYLRSEHSSHSKTKNSNELYGEEAKTTATDSNRTRHIAPTFIQRLSSTQVLEGEELLLQCELTGDPDLLTSWKRNGKQLGFEDDEVFTSFRDGFARLRLRDMQPHHAGEYICIAKNKGGTVQCSSRVTVKARKVEMRPRFLRNPPDIRIYEGETLTIEAEVDGTPTPEIVWSLDGEEIAGGETSLRNNLARLILHNVTSSHSGQYMCSALNVRGEDSVACRVRVRRNRVESPPEFLSHLNDVTTDEDNDVCLRCVVKGYPEPTIEWMYNEEVITSEDGVNITYEDGVASLILEQATQEDSGCYTCVANNSVGRTLSQCRVIVNGPIDDLPIQETCAPSFVSPFEEYIRVQEGDSLTLECEVSGFPHPQVMWEINGGRVENGKEEYENGRAKLNISPVTSSHGGHIKCILNNQAGEASYQARIYVRSKRAPPVFETMLPETISMVEGEEAYFECKVKGHPQPRVIWSRNGRSLSVLSAETSYENGVASVRVRKAGPRDAGRYACVARNLSGEAETSCTVEFVEKNKSGLVPKEKPPVFTHPLQDVDISDGEDLHLECRVAGIPEPQISWMVEGEMLHPEDGDFKYADGIATLTLGDVMKDDSGEYQCVAVNRAGKATITCHVNVTSPKQSLPTELPDAEPTFLVPLEDLTIEEGRDLTLRCRVKGNPLPKVKWQLNEEDIKNGEEGYLEDGFVELMLREVRSEDTGIYTCIAENPIKRISSSCVVSIKKVPKVPSKSSKQMNMKKESHPTLDANLKTSDEQSSSTPTIPDCLPEFTQPLEDVVAQDGTSNFFLMCRVKGNPTAKWYHDNNEIEQSEDFQMISNGDVRKLVFTEVFPDDSGIYCCVVKNQLGETRSNCYLTVEEIEGEPPTFTLKPRPLTVRTGSRAVFSCRVDGDPPPTVQWIFCNQVLKRCDRFQITEASVANNYTHTLEIPNVSAKEGGKYSACGSNLLGDVTCTISLVVDDVKKQETQKDFRNVLKKSPSVKSPTGKSVLEENIDFRSVLKKAPIDKDSDRRLSDSNEQMNVAYKEVLSTSVKTRTLSEEERKAQKAEQRDFRAKLVRKVDTKLVTQDSLRTKGTDQIDFRDEALKTKVRTKAVGQEDLKVMHVEQKDFRKETIKSKVVTKAYREDAIKVKRAEQVDFRKVLSPTKRDEPEKFNFEETGTTIADIPRGKWKKDVDHTTVTTRRARHRAPAIASEQKTTPKNPVGREPQFSKELCDITVRDGSPFGLTCHVTGTPQPSITWFLGKEQIKSETEIKIIQEGEVCKLEIEESFPEDRGTYTCFAENKHGKASCSCYVTVIEDAD